MRTDDLDYPLPEQLIAAAPADRRDAARLMVAYPDRVEHRIVADLPDLLAPGDLLIFNDTRVLPAKFTATRADTGGRVEGLFLQMPDDRTWHVLLQSGGRLMPGERLRFALDGSHELELLHQHDDGSWSAAKHSPLDTRQLLDRVGSMPLPPYITNARRKRGDHIEDTIDRARYQTIYAALPGAVAAPTAGLHFTQELMARLQTRGVEMAFLTLHVGLGTFAPVRTDTLEAHPMHAERFTIPASTLAALRHARAEGRRIIPVGTTSVRALESLPDSLPTVDYSATTDLLIQPGFKLRFVEGLMTNFHLPRSTLLALVAAVTGLDRLKQLYASAVAQQYRFYSYGDAMLILPSAVT